MAKRRTAQERIRDEARKELQAEEMRQKQKDGTYTRSFQR
jgi:hypothetical protein